MEAAWLLNILCDEKQLNKAVWMKSGDCRFSGTTGRILRDMGKGRKCTTTASLTDVKEKGPQMSDRPQADVLALGCCYLNCTHSVHHSQYVSKWKNQKATKNLTCWQSLSAQTLMTLRDTCSCVHKSDGLLSPGSMSLFECVFTFIFFRSIF